MYISIIGWIGVITVIVGYYLNAHKNIYSWFLWGIGNVLIGIYSYFIEAWSTLFLSLLLIIINFYGWRNWKKDE